MTKADHGILTAIFLLILILSGCASYQALPLITQVQKTPSIEQLTVQAKTIKHPLLKALNFNMADGLSPDEAAILAVLRHPQLRAIRDLLGIANAQLLQAGLLPDPQLSYSFAAPSAGTNLNMNNAFGLGLNWQVSALIWRQNKRLAADKQRQAVDLNIAWQEWQIAQAARLATYQLIIYRQQWDLLNTMKQRLVDNSKRLQQAANQGLVTELKRVAAISAKNRVENRLLALEKQIKQQQQKLNRAIGLNPYDTLKLQQQIDLDRHPSIETYQTLTREIAQRRLDLIALKYGYESQEERVHIAVLQQFPKISIGFHSARDNSNLYTMGFGVSMTLPVFNRNQGKIAIHRATRQQLFDQYSNRLFQARADIAELLVTIDALNRQIESVARAIPNLNHLLKAYRSAIRMGQVDVLNYYTAWNRLTNKKIMLLTLKLQLKQAQIALDTATGLYHSSTHAYLAKQE